MTKPKLVLATAKERAEYAAQIPPPVYPLHGWVHYQGLRLPLEDLRGYWTRPDPVWEVIAPEGVIFHPDFTHSLLGQSQADILDRVNSCSVVRCSCESCARVWTRLESEAK